MSSKFLKIIFDSDHLLCRYNILHQFHKNGFATNIFHGKKKKTLIKKQKQSHIFLLQQTFPSLSGKKLFLLGTAEVLEQEKMRS